MNAERAASPLERTNEEIKRSAKIAAMSGAEQAWEDMCHLARELATELAAAREQVAERARLVEIRNQEAAAANSEIDRLEKALAACRNTAERALSSLVSYDKPLADHIRASMSAQGPT